MADRLTKVFREKKEAVNRNTSTSLSLSDEQQGEPVFIAFATAGYPSNDDTVPILLAMQEGGTDVIELGMPFSDPIADGPAIQDSNSVC